MASIGQWLKASIARLRNAGIPDNLLEAEVLLTHVLGVDRLYLHTYPEREIPTEDLGRLGRLLTRRCHREPLAYLTGKREFYGRTFIVTPSVLIPRPETEVLVEAVLQRLPKDRTVTIADIGTGSGIIALSLTCEIPLAHVFATDLSSEALEVARLNATQFEVEERVTFLQGDLCLPLETVSLEGRCDALCSNPPYIPTAKVAALEPEIRDWEPRIAVDGGSEGIGPTAAIISQASRFLKPGGWLALEMAAGFAEEVSSLIGSQTALEAIAVLPDLAGIERVALARRKG